MDAWRASRLAGIALALVSVLGVAAGLGERAHASRASLSYHWPIKPFDSQHPIRAAFGDPRTLVRGEPFGSTGPADGGSYSFHGGIDIVAPAGTPVYPVVSGVVVLARPDKIIVHSSGDRSFQYYHLVLAVHRGQHVVAERTVLGTIQRERNHVHLGEIDGHRGQNPLAPGHLEPYRDSTRPTEGGLYVGDEHGWRLLRGQTLSPYERLAVAAGDPPAMTVPGRYGGLPQAPALVEWRVLGTRATVWQVAADFRTTQPGPLHFWQVYAPGTYQNCPVFENRLFLGSPGRYLFRLGLDPAGLGPGQYRLAVRVVDVRGNSRTTIWPIRIARGA